MAKIWPLQSPVKHNKYSTYKIIAVPSTAYIIRCWHRPLQHNSQNWKNSVKVQSVSHWQHYCSTVLSQIFPSHSSWGSHSRTGSITAPQCSIKYSLLTPVEVQSVSHWQYYCSTVLNKYSLLTPVEVQSVSHWRHYCSTVLSKYSLLTRVEVQSVSHWQHYCSTVLNKYSLLTPVEVQSVSHWQHYCSTVLNKIFPSHSSWGTVSLALTALLQHSAQ